MSSSHMLYVDSLYYKLLYVYIINVNTNADRTACSLPGVHKLTYNLKLHLHMSSFTYNLKLHLFPCSFLTSYLKGGWLTCRDIRDNIMWNLAHA